MRLGTGPAPEPAHEVPESVSDPAIRTLQLSERPLQVNLVIEDVRGRAGTCSRAEFPREWPGGRYRPQTRWVALRFGGQRCCRRPPDCWRACRRIRRSRRNEKATQPAPAPEGHGCVSFGVGL